MKTAPSSIARATAASPRLAPVARTASSRTARPATPADDEALLEDIRFLGRILGDVIREQEGRDAFDLIERVRKLSVAYRVKRDAAAGRTLDRLLKNLTVDQTVSVVRAFSYFSHLANIAEDRHQVRRRELNEHRGALEEGSLAMTLERLAGRDIRAAEIAGTLRHAHISPVLTAHPTEVQRKSILDAQRAVAELIGQRDTLRTERDRQANERLLRARVTQLWQTRMLRYAKLTVWLSCQDALSRITGETERLASNPSLARSIGHRFPYLDPLNHLQVELMRRYRQSSPAEPAGERVKRGIHLSINGVAAGLRNTG